jgi:hypothetical protein
MHKDAQRAINQAVDAAWEDFIKHMAYSYSDKLTDAQLGEKMDDLNVQWENCVEGDAYFSAAEFAVERDNLGALRADRGNPEMRHYADDLKNLMANIVAGIGPDARRVTVDVPDIGTRMAVLLDDQSKLEILGRWNDAAGYALFHCLGPDLKQELGLLDPAARYVREGPSLSIVEPDGPDFG